MTWPVPSWRLAVVVALAAIALWLLPEVGTTELLGFSIDNRLWIVNGVLLAVAVLDVVAAPRPASVGIERIHPRAVTLADDAQVQWRVEGPSRRRPGRSAWVGIADQLAPSLQATTRRFEVKIPTRGHATATVDFRPSRRGRFEPTELVVRTSGPLGLMYKQRARRLATTLKVLPPFRSAKDAELAVKKARILETGLRTARGRGSGTEFDSLREMTPDDETRRIDWAATARSQRPIVRTYRAERNQTVLCLVDSGRTMAGRVQGVPRMEFAMDGSMLLAELATGLGDRVGLLAFDQDVNVTVEPSNRRSQRSVISERLFDLEPALAESNHLRAVTHVLARYRRRSLLVLMTELVPEVVEQFLIPALPLLIRTHVVVVAAVRDPDMARWAVETEDDVDGAFLRAAAIAAVAERERLAAVLRGMGTVVVDVEPDRFAAELGEVYLDAKARGRL